MQNHKTYEGTTKTGEKIRYTVAEHLTTASFESESDVEDAGHKPSRKIEVGTSEKGNFVTREVTYGDPKVVVLGHHVDKAALIASLDPADSLTAELVESLNEEPELPSGFTEV
jgi:hypothetical protein